MSSLLRLCGAVSTVLLLTLAGVPAPLVQAQGQPPVVVLIDRDSITHGQPPNDFTTQDVNDELAAIGMRDSLPFFTRNIGKTVSLATGRSDSEGWLALTNVPAAWVSEPGENDGLENYIVAGPGLGSADADGNRTSLLQGVGIRKLTSADIALLQGRTVCGVVYQGNLSPDAAGGGLAGTTLGVVALRVVTVNPGSGPFPQVEAEILDAAGTCGGNLTLPEAVPGLQ